MCMCIHIYKYIYIHTYICRERYVAIVTYSSACLGALEPHLREARDAGHRGLCDALRALERPLHGSGARSLQTYISIYIERER